MYIGIEIVYGYGNVLIVEPNKNLDLEEIKDGEKIMTSKSKYVKFCIRCGKFNKKGHILCILCELLYQNISDLEYKIWRLKRVKCKNKKGR